MDAVPSPAQIAKATSGAFHLFIAKHYALASVGLSFYEWFITFDREVESVWKRKHGFVTVLWVLNRYLPSVGHIPTQVAMLHPMGLNRSAELAVEAWILVVLFPFYFASFAVETWAVAGGAPVPRSPWFSGCILTGKPHGGFRIAGLWISQLVFPTAVFALTTARVLRLKQKGRMHSGSNSIAALMLRDGTMYFFVIFFINLLNVLTYLLSPFPDLQAVNASFSSIMQGIMICRLMLNLRGGMTEPVVSGGSGGRVYDSGLSNHVGTFVGNLGAEIDVSDEDPASPPAYGQPRNWRRTSIVIQRGYTKNGAAPGEDSFFEKDEAPEALRRIRNMVSRV